MFHSIIYVALHSDEFKVWAEENCKGEWGYEYDSFVPHNVGQPGIFSGWMYDDQDAMLFKLTFA